MDCIDVLPYCTFVMQYIDFDAGPLHPAHCTLLNVTATLNRGNA